MKSKLFFKYLFFLIVLFLLVGCEPRLTTLWDGKVAGRFYQGAGTVTDPWQISSTQELAYLANQVNKGKDFQGEYFRLVANLDLAGLRNGKGWTPIGEKGVFNGLFDGDGYCINNIYTVAKAADVPSGLFGEIGAVGKVQNLCINNCIHEKVRGETGAIAGINAGTIEACEINGKIMAGGGVVGKNTGNVADCHMDGNLTVYHLDDYLNERHRKFTEGIIPIGGITCYNYGKISRCLFQGLLSTHRLWGDGGGICYENTGEIRECAAMGVIAGQHSVSKPSGGIAAISGGNIIDCYSNGFNSSGPYTSPIVAKVQGDYSIQNCYTASECPDCACIVGKQSEPDQRVVNCYNRNGCYYAHKVPLININRLGARLPDDMKTDAFVRQLGEAWAEDVEGINKGYPILKNLCYAEGTEEVTDDIGLIAERLKDSILAVSFSRDLGACGLRYGGLMTDDRQCMRCYKEKFSRGIEVYFYLYTYGDHKWVLMPNTKPDAYQFTVVFSDSSYPGILKEQLLEKLNMQDDLYQEVGGMLISLIDADDEGNSLTIKIDKNS